ncbi:MAG TPA: ABC transporter permease [Solirubrobacteraceae bacterium]|nr:ABC transporter permease [Solirubrobacteraceae bacterium]
MTIGLALVVVAVFVVWAIVPGMIAPGEPGTTDLLNTFASPSWAHPFGTDDLGRDVFDRVVHGTRSSILVGLGATLISLLLGGTVGLVCGLSRGWLGQALARVVDMLMSFPGLLMALTIISVVGSGSRNIALALGVASLPAFARLVRGEVLRVRDQPFIDAAVGAGVRRSAIVIRHVIPNVAGAILAFAGIALGIDIIAASSLSFLGFGPALPAADWGSLIAGGRDSVSDAWWITFFPGLMVALVVLAVTRLSSRGGAGPLEPAA